MSGGTGFDASNFIKGLQDAQRRAEEAARQAMDVFGEHVIGDAQQLTPVRTGALQASGTAEPAVLEGGTLSKTIGFNTEYAAAVHERLRPRHPVGRAKFLETAMRENAPKLAKFVEGRVEQALR